MTLTDEQREALTTFAAKHGSRWKDRLLDAWMTGRDASEPNGHALRQVRNRFGPSWLADQDTLEFQP